MTNEVLQKTASDEQNVSSSNGLEPRLRFPSFDNKWTLTTIGNVCAFTNGKAHEQNVVEYGEYIIVNSKFISSDGVVKKYSNKQICPLFKNDIVMVMSDVPNGKAMSKCFCIDKDNKYTLNQRICALRTKQIPLYYMMQINRNDYFMKFDDGVKQTNLRKDDVLACPVYSTTIKEQTKIADFLSLIDQRIEKQRRLVESLKKYKRGLLSAIFDNKLIGENWKKYKLSSILKERSTYSEKDGSYEHVTLSRDGIIPKTERYDRDFLVSSENKKYKITKMGDICYNPANMKFGVICLNTYGNAIFSPIYITFEIKSDFDKPFVGLYMTRNDFINRSLKFQQGTVYERMAVSPEDLLSMDIELPNLEAQKRISNIFTILDKKIVRENNIFNELQKMKRALLQQMFI